jgi:hypothetical protein
VYKSKEESSSPTIAIESLFLTAIIIDAKEQRDVITCDILGAFLHADIDEVLHMHSVLKAQWQNFWWRSIQIYMGHA